jgi:hypothetical protein
MSKRNGDGFKDKVLSRAYARARRREANRKAHLVKHMAWVRSHRKVEQQPTISQRSNETPENTGKV